MFSKLCSQLKVFFRDTSAFLTRLSKSESVQKVVRLIIAALLYAFIDVVKLRGFESVLWLVDNIWQA